MTATSALRVLRLSTGTLPSIAAWLAEQCEPVAIPEGAAHDPHFQYFHQLAEDSYEAFLSVPLMCRGRVVGVLNLLHRQHHVYRRREIRLISNVGFLLGAEIELARLEEVNLTLVQKLATRKVVERAKGILQRDLRLNEQQAYLFLQQQSCRERKVMREVAEAVLLGEEVRGNSHVNLSSGRRPGHSLQHDEPFRLMPPNAAIRALSR